MSRRQTLIAVAIGLVALALVLVRRRRATPRKKVGQRTRIGAAELGQALAGDHPPLLLDIRGRNAFEADHLPGAVHLPLIRLPSTVARLDRSAPTVVY